MFKGKNKTVEFQDEQLEVKGISVYRAIALRGKIGSENVDATEENLKTMAEVISECVVSPVLTVEQVMGLDLETFQQLFDIVSKANGLTGGNEPAPATT